MKHVTFETTKGTFTAELYDDAAPGTVANFEKLVRQGYYDGILFHRVIPDFVVQGGDPITKGPQGLNHPDVGSGGPGYSIRCETDGNPHTHKVGALSMARSAVRHTGGSQFFIVLSESATRHLNGEHTVFGQVTEGMDVVNRIQEGDRMDKLTMAEGGAD